jgi:hypothetical protein
MKGFNFEKNLNHQSHAVDSTIGVFQDISLFSQPKRIKITSILHLIFKQETLIQTTLERLRKITVA